MTPTCVSYQAFRMVFLTIGEARQVKTNKSATLPAYLIKLIFNQELICQHTALYKKNEYSSSAQLCSRHTIDEIQGQQLLTVINFPRKQVGKHMSDCLVTGVQKECSNLQEKKESTVFIKPSSVIELGARVGLLAEEELITENPRDIEFWNFLSLDLRIGTLEECQELQEIKEAVNQVFYRINLGDELGTRRCIARLHATTPPEAFVGKQVLVLTNLDLESKEQLFGVANGEEVILCTVAGVSILEPAIPVENGYKLA